MENTKDYFRDGTSQKGRMLKALNPSCVSADERENSDFLRYAKVLGERLKYYNDLNQYDGNWAQMFSFSDEEISEISAIINDPYSFSSKHYLYESLSKPHIALFLSFLKLLSYPMEMFRGLTKRHLDFYYRDILKLKEKAAEPDKVHVVFGISDGTDEHLVEKGTLFNGGKDQNGNELVYELDDDVIINKAKVTGINTLKVIKKSITLKSIHGKHNRDAAGFQKMLEFALGKPVQEDPLPPFVDKKGASSVVDTAFLRKLYKEIKNTEDERIDESSKNYILNILGFVRVSDFKTVIDVHEREIQKGSRGVTPPEDKEWDNVYSLVEGAFKKRITIGRRETLEKIHLEDSFDAMMEHALGDPAEGDKLPAVPDGISIEKLYEKTLSGDLSDSLVKYIENSLFMTVDNFRTIMNKAYSEENSDHTVAWTEVYRLLEKSWAKKRSFKYPDISKNKIADISASQIKDGNVSSTERFSAFGSDISDYESKSEIGFGVSSEILGLSEGKREVKINFVCKDTIDLTRFNEIIRETPAPFRVSYSTESGWQEVPDYTAMAGNFLLQDKITRYKSDMRLVLTGSKIFNGEFNYIRLRDGSIYEITKIISSDKAEAVSSGFEKNDGAMHSIKSVSVEDGRVIDGEITRSEEIIVTAGESFSSEDNGHFVRLKDGSIYQIEEVIDASSVRVQYRGKEAKNNSQIISEILVFSDDKIISSEVNISGIVSNGESFDKSNINKYIRWGNGLVLLILNMAGSGELVVKPEGYVEKNYRIELYNEKAVCFNALKIGFLLDSTEPSIASSGEDKKPSVKILLKSASECGEFYYEFFRSMKTENIIICVKVDDYRNLKLRNDQGLINPKTPFEIFGNMPRPGSGFYIAGSEICEKKLDTLSICLRWMNLPDDFGKYYESYVKSGVLKSVSNEDFKTSLNIMDNRVLMETGTFPLFVSSEKEGLSENLVIKSDNFSITGYREKKIDITDDPSELKRYFKLELAPPGFHGDLYHPVMNKTVQLNLRQTDDTKLIDTANEPFLPKVKDISVSYSASAETEHNENTIDFFHVNPFGVTKESFGGNFPYLLKDYNSEGYLNIGFDNCKRNGVQSVLFRFVEGTGNPLCENPEIKWDYLTDAGWVPFNNRDILSDDTDSMTKSGIIKFSIPEDISMGSTSMPEGLWIRAKVLKDSEAIPDLIDIKPQAASLTFKKKNNGSENNNILPAGSIKELRKKDPSVLEVSQPYSSWGGRRPETGNDFYTRVSERLRHRQRAVNIWDFERIVLEKFPEIYKVKCIRDAEYEAGTDPCEIRVVVIPDISNAKPFFPLEPRVPVNVLKKIEEYLKRYSSPFVKVSVKNPVYEQIKYRVAIKFNEGCNTGFYLKKINDDLKRFLSPWAYEDGSDISFGSRIYSSSVIHFLEKRPYIDYIARLKLIEHTTGTKVTEFGTTGNASDDIACVHSPDAILVSAPFHIIDVITTDTYEEEAFEGIGYMIVGTDLIVSPPDAESTTVGFMKIGDDFTLK